MTTSKMLGVYLHVLVKTKLWSSPAQEGGVIASLDVERYAASI